MTKTIVALGGSIESLPILRRIKELGYRLVVVDGNRNAAGFAIADFRVVASCYDTEATLAELEPSLYSRYPNLPFGGVICAAIDAPLVAAEVACAFGLPGLSLEAAALGADKWKQNEKLQEAGVPVPMAYLADSLLDVPSDKFWVIKPRDSRGARGVIRVPRGHGGGWHYIGELVNRSKAQSPTGRVMVEEWLDGPQLSTESLVQDGKVLFTAVGLRNYARLDEFAPYVVEDGFDEPAQVTYTAEGYEFLGQGDSTPKISELIERACAALGWNTCVCKGDLVIHNGKLHVIELAPRLSGGLFCAAHELACGVDFIGAAINMALGFTIEHPKQYQRQFVSQRYLFPEPSWIGKRIVEQRIRVLPQYHVFAHHSKPIGHVIQPVTAHPDRLGQALCVGATPQEARERAERAVKAMKDGMVIE